MPSASTIRPVYRVLSGVGALLLNALPADLVARLQGQFKKMLQIVDLEDHVSSLYCLAVLAFMSSPQHPATSLSESQSSSPLAKGLLSTIKELESYHVARQYFTSKRATKTLDLVVLKVIYACSKSCTLSPAAILESLQLSNTIIEAIDVRDRQQWMTHNRGKFRKLVEKIVLYDRESEMMSPFICTLAGDGPVPQELTLVYKAALCAPFTSKLPRLVGEKALLLLDELSIQDQLLWILQEASHELNNFSTLFKVQAALVIVESFTASIEHSAPLRQKLLYLLSTNTVGKPLRHFLDVTPNLHLTGINHDYVDVCPHFYTEQLTTLHQKVCLLFLKTALLSESDSVGLDASLGSALLRKMMSTGGKTSCERYKPDMVYRKRTTVALFEASSTPDAHTGSEQWRERIMHDLAQNAEYQYQTIVRTMGDACQDLERRCDEIERPLREEQAKSKQLHDNLGELRLRITELESQNHEQSLYIEGLDHEKSELADSMRYLKGEREDLLNQVKGLRQALQEASQRTEEVAGNSTNRIQQLELIHAAAIAEKEEEFDADRHSMQGMRARIEKLEDDAARMRERASATSEEVVSLETIIREQETALTRTNTVVDEKRTECDKQMGLINRLETEKGDLQNELQVASNTNQALSEDLDARAAAIQAQSAELSRVRSEYETELSEQSHKIVQIQKASEEKVKGLQNLLHRQTEEAVQAAEESKATVRRLESRLVKLKGEIKNRESELEEAQGLTNQVMAFWNRQRRRNVTIEGSLRVPEDNQGDKFIASHQPARSSHASETPPEAKRTKIHQRFGSRGYTEDKVGAGTPRLRSEAALDREPLPDLDIETHKRFNVTPTGNKARTGTSADKNANNENTGVELVEGSFCDSDFFASSDQNLIAGVHAKEPDEISDDTTMDF
ncbi:MAG: hypothetical protein Q9216_003424 [Gyalolechia sp. 2 TL-2023]